MRRETYLLSIVLMFGAASAHAQMPASSLIVSETSVIRFTPAVPSGDVREGSCGRESLMVTRQGAWRCSVENVIHDPCFAVPANHGQLVCDADPALKTGGFVLKLTKPLPEPAHLDWKPEPWVFRLADNSICKAALSANGHPIRWSCTIYVRDQVRPDGVVTALKPGKIWMANKYSESAVRKGLGSVDAEKVPVKVIWQ